MCVIPAIHGVKKIKKKNPEGCGKTSPNIYLLTSEGNTYQSCNWMLHLLTGRSDGRAERLNTPLQFHFCLDWCRSCSVCVQRQSLPRYRLPRSRHLEWLLLTSIFILPSLFHEPLIRKGQPCREWYKPQSMSPWVPIPLLYLLCNDRIFNVSICFIITSVYSVHKWKSDISWRGHFNVTQLSKHTWQKYQLEGRGNV